MTGKVIPAKVAGLISETQVAFNVGSDAGVSVGDIAQVVKNVDVDDPDTGDRLGTVALIRLNLKIVHVQERLSVGAVTDYSASSAATVLAGSRRRKKVGLVGDGVYDDGMVKISLGESVIIKKPEPADEPPF